MTPTTPPTADIDLTPDLIDRVMKLSVENKEKLVGLLLDEQNGPPDNPDEVAAAWKAEIARRAALVASGNYTAYSVEEVNEYVWRAVEEARRK